MGFARKNSRVEIIINDITTKEVFCFQYAGCDTVDNGNDIDNKIAIFNSVTAYKVLYIGKQEKKFMQMNFNKVITFFAMYGSHDYHVRIHNTILESEKKFLQKDANERTRHGTTLYGKNLTFVSLVIRRVIEE